MDRTTHQFYEQEAQRYRQIHERPLLRYSSDLERELIRPHLPPTGTVLDVGCGEGRTTRYLAELVSGTIIGLDFSCGMVRQADAARNRQGLCYCVGDAQALPFPAGSLDLVTAMTTLNNVPDIRAALGEAARVLKTGGMLAATVINRLEAARAARAVYFAPYYLYRSLGSQRKSIVRRVYDREQLLELIPPSLEIVSCQGMRVLPDFLPEIPFNFWRPLFGLTRRIFDACRPLDMRLARHSFFGRYARFHLLMARKR